MRNKRAKQLKKMFSADSNWQNTPFGTTTSNRRAYRRAKRQYNRVPHNQKGTFLKALADQLAS